MIKLTKEEKKILKNAVDKMRECNLLNGQYDAYNGNSVYMSGVGLVMEMLTSFVSDEYYEEWDRQFINNLVKSEIKADKRRAREGKQPSLFYFIKNF